MPLAQDVIRALSSVLEEECRLHERYIACLQEERIAVSKFQTDKVNSSREKREQLIVQMQDIHQRRVQLTKQITPSGVKPKLGDLVENLGSADDKRRILPLVKKLRELVSKERRSSTEGASVTQFALNLVHGAFSILWSATQNVTRSYTRYGAIEEKYQAVKASTLRKA